MAVCFRGTEPSEISDILADLKAWQSRSETDGWVHSGFKTELDKVWEDVLQYVNKYSDWLLVLTSISTKLTFFEFM